MSRNYKYQLYKERKPGFWDEFIIQKIIGIVILLILATIISTVLAFYVVFVWTYPVQRLGVMVAPLYTEQL